MTQFVEIAILSTIHATTLRDANRGILTEVAGSVQLTSLYELGSTNLLPLMLKMFILLFYETSYLDKEVNSTKSFPLVRVPHINVPKSWACTIKSNLGPYSQNFILFVT